MLITSRGRVHPRPLRQRGQTTPISSGEGTPLSGGSGGTVRGYRTRSSDCGQPGDDDVRCARPSSAGTDSRPAPEPSFVRRAAPRWPVFGVRVRWPLVAVPTALSSGPVPSALDVRHRLPESEPVRCEVRGVVARLGAGVVFALASCGGEAPSQLPGAVMAIDAASGEQRWYTEIDETAVGSPVVREDVVEVLSVHMPLRCQFDVAAVTMDASTGDVTNRSPVRPAPVFYSSDPNVRTVWSGDVSYTSTAVHDRDGELRVFATRSDADRPLWSRTFPGDGPAGLAVAPAVVVAAWPSFIASESGVSITVAALDADTGEVVWSTELDAEDGWGDRRLGQRLEMFAPVHAVWESWDMRAPGYVAPGSDIHGMTTVAAVAERVFVPTGDDTVAVLSVADGRHTDELIGRGPVTTAGDHVVIRRDDSLVAIDVEGHVRWARELPAWAPLVRLTGTDETVFVGLSGRYGGGPCPLD